VTEYNIQDDEEDRYEEDDPRSWRNHCGGETKSLGELLDDWKNKYYKLEWMGHESNGWPTTMWADRGDENYEEVKVSHTHAISKVYLRSMLTISKGDAQDHEETWVAKLVQQGSVQAGLEGMGSGTYGVI
jgi:hypothetical protein